MQLLKNYYLCLFSTFRLCIQGFYISATEPTTDQNYYFSLLLVPKKHSLTTNDIYIILDNIRIERWPKACRRVCIG